MTNNQIQELIADYHAGIRNDKLRHSLIRAREHFNNDKNEEMSCESEDLNDPQADEEAWKQMVEWLERHGKNT